MNPILYKSNETDFNHRGLGTFTETLEYKVEEVLNGEFELYMEYPVTGHLYKLIEDSLMIKAKPNRKDEPHLFRIYDHEFDTVSQTVYIYARSNTFDLSGNMVRDVAINNATPQQAMDSMKANLIESTDFTFYSDITTQSSTRWTRRNALNCIAGEQGSLLQYWGGEIKRGNNWLWLYRRRGNDNVTTIRYGKDLSGLKAKYSIKGLVTAILPYYVKRDVDSEETFVGDVVKSRYVNNYPVVYYDSVEFDEEDGVTDLNSLNAVASNYFTNNVGKDLPSINMEIQLIDLSHTKEYEKFKGLEEVEIGDTITVYAKKYDVHLLAKVTKVVYNGNTDQNEIIEIGTVRASSYDDYKQIINRTIEPVKNQINIVQIAANGKNRIYRGPDEPTQGLSSGDLWYKPVGDGDFELYIYNGHTWGDPVVTTGVNNEVNQRLEEAKDIAETAKDNTDLLQLDADSILAGLGIEGISETNQNIVDQIKVNVGDRINSLGGTLETFNKENIARVDQLQSDISEDIDEIYGELGKKPDETDVIQYVDEAEATIVSSITAIKNNPEEQLAGYNTLKSTVNGNVTEIGRIKESPAETITGYNTMIETVEGNQQTIARIKSMPGEEIINYQRITETVDLYERVIGSSENDVESNVSRIVSSSEIIRLQVAQEVVRSFNEMPEPIWQRDAIHNLSPGGPSSFTLPEELEDNVEYRLDLSSTTSPDPFVDDIRVLDSTDVTVRYLGEESGRYKYTVIFTRDTSSSGILPKNHFRLRTHGAPLLGIQIQGLWRMSDVIDVANQVDSLSTTVDVLSGSFAVSIKNNDELVAAINASSNGVYIGGKNIILDADTLVDGSFTVTDTIFARNMSISKFTAGTLNAANVNLINVNVNSLVGNVSNFVQSAWNAINSRVTLTGQGMRINTTNSWDLWLDNRGIELTDKSGNVTGKLTALVSLGTGEPLSLGLVAEPGFDVIMGYQGTTSTNQYHRSIAVDGLTGDTHFYRDIYLTGSTNTIYPNRGNTSDSFYFNTIASPGVVIRHSNNNGAGIILRRDGRVQVTGDSTLIVPEIRPFSTSHTGVKLQTGTVSGNEGVWIGDHTDSSGIFMARNGNLYIRLRGSIYDLRTVLNNSGFPNA